MWIFKREALDKIQKIETKGNELTDDQKPKVEQKSEPETQAEEKPAQEENTEVDQEKSDEKTQDDTEEKEENCRSLPHPLDN